MNKDNTKVWHIAFCVDDKYSVFIRPAVLSIAATNTDNLINIHILSDNISEKNSEALLEVISSYKNINIRIHHIDDTDIKKLKTGNWSIHTWYRVLLPDILDESIEKVLYLDADTLVLGDLKELFDLDMQNIAVAGAIDFQSEIKWNQNQQSVFERLSYPREKGYICAGVLMMNLDYWRKHNLSKNLIEWSVNNANLLGCPDQDAINYLCRDNKYILPMKYGFMNCFYERDEFHRPPYQDQYKDCIENPVIIHYNGTPPWWKEYKRHVRYADWVRYNKMLKHPVKRRYKISGMLLFKHLVYKHLTSKLRK